MILHENETMQHEVLESDIQQYDDKKYCKLLKDGDELNSMVQHSHQYEHEILQFVSEHILLNNDYLDEIHKYYDYGLIQIQTILDHVYSFIEIERIKHYSECFDDLIVYEKNFMQLNKLQLNITNGITEQ